MELESVLFDFGGTLDADGVAWLDRFRPLYVEEGVQARKDRLDRAFYDSDDSLPVRHNLAGLGLEETLRLQVGGVLERTAPEMLGSAGAIANRFASASRRHLERNRPILERLRRRWRLGIVSNFYGNLDSILRTEGFEGLFDVISDSGVIGVLKPAPGIFLHALRALGTQPSRALMVGDSVARDMQGAEKLGMPHVWLRGARRGSAACCDKGGVIASLTELEAALETGAV